ncbi:MAG: hypothetical protein AAF570_26290, partial [Bacteroidota bacterium]
PATSWCTRLSTCHCYYDTRLCLDCPGLETYRRPQGHGVRVDDGFEEGMDIPIYYDPMIAKLITYAATREEAIDKMLRAISEYQIVGFETTLGLCAFALQHEAFTSGNFDTHFVKNYFEPSVLNEELGTKEAEVAALVGAFAFAADAPAQGQAQPAVTAGKSKWRINRT